MSGNLLMFGVLIVSLAKIGAD